MRKVIMTLCFNRPDVVAGAIQRLKQTQDLTNYEYYLIDVGYPLPDKRENAIKLAEIAHNNNVDLLRPYKNRGVAVNWMWACVELELKIGDVLIGMDPDSVPVTKGWADAVTDVLINEQYPMGYCGLTRTTPPQLSTEVDESNKPYTLHEINGRKVRKYAQPVSWPMGGFNVEFMRTVGIHQPRSHYGFIEMGTMKKMRDTKWDWCLLDEFYDETHDRGEDLYKKWKVLQAQGTYQKDFIDFIKEGQNQ